jgi:hypothetical protein
VRIRRPPVVAAAILALATGTSLGFLAPPATLAFLVDSATSVATFTTDGLDPPTSLSATGGASAALAWTPTVDTYASGYQVLRSTTSGSGYAQVATATPRTASSYADVPATDGTYYYVLRSYLSSWTSAQTAEVSAVVKMGNTGLKACTTQSADTNGDANGYEVSAANGCADDGLAASDVNSGTSTSTSCANTGKDRHRFATFGLGLPGAVTSINGITVKVKEALDATAGTNLICAQLSWNAGTSWTATQQVNVTSTAQTWYTLGGSAFLWGRAWAVGDLSDANFRVRLIDVSSVTTRDFFLDSVQVQVNYTP